MEINITRDIFEKEVLQSELPVLIDLWADWCGPCKMLSPVVSEIADEYDGVIKVGKINVDEQPELAAAFKAESIPLVVIVKGRKVVDATVGYQPKEQLKEFVDKNLK